MKSGSPSRLKRPVLIIGVLLLLAGIGFESLVRQERMPHRAAATTRGEEKNTRSSRFREAVVSDRETAPPPSAVPELAAENLPDPSPENAPVAQARRTGSGATTGRLPSQIYYIRSHSLLKGRVEGQSLASAIEMLQRAVVQVGSTLPQGTLVFDAEGLATSRSRLVSYAKPGYDLTDEVAAVFDQLQLQQQKLSEGRQTGK